MLTALPENTWRGTSLGHFLKELKFRMPKETFLQLKREKREHILRTAAKVLAERGFARTDVAGIARQAGVAKGSLYNYFANKEDLYLHVCRDGMQRSHQAVYGQLDDEKSIFDQIDHIFRNGFAFAQTHPEYIRLYLNVASAGMERFAEELTLEVEKFTADYLKKLIENGIRDGCVRTDIDVNMTAFLINNLYVMLLVSLVSRHFQIRLNEYLKTDNQGGAVSAKEALAMVIGLIHDLLRPRLDKRP